MTSLLETMASHYRQIIIIIMIIIIIIIIIIIKYILKREETIFKVNCILTKIITKKNY